MKGPKPSSDKTRSSPVPNGRVSESQSHSGSNGQMEAAASPPALAPREHKRFPAIYTFILENAAPQVQASVHVESKSKYVMRLLVRASYEDWRISSTPNRRQRSENVSRLPPAVPVSNSSPVNGARQHLVSLDQYPWYVGTMERPKAQLALDPLRDGTFLIRVTNNPTRQGELSLSIKYDNAVRHIKVNRSPDGRFYLAEIHFFDSVQVSGDSIPFIILRKDPTSF
ncbi:vav 2 guanine nucleotide exchange factor [Plakobranchus ocellatus]|uniref:Vav 2 guanine nucleotide exchange factor n=1 Tax=Plakobranchus ocellatus TaxID=259542 RepID=A0AAV3YKP8_9GAST|nr:vav 2 guanine nucleotide exchange factor [Plakobranchus ocellatus]